MSKLAEINKDELTDEWIKALRSGEYTQGSGRLRTDSTYCCLGVVCDVLAKQGVGEWVYRNDGDEMDAEYQGWWFKVDPMNPELDDPSFLPLPVANALELHTDGSRWGHTFNIGPEKDVNQSLSIMNDDYHFDFERIARVLEQRKRNEPTS